MLLASSLYVNGCVCVCACVCVCVCVLCALEGLPHADSRKAPPYCPRALFEDLEPMRLTLDAALWFNGATNTRKSQSQPSQSTNSTER